MAPHPLKQLASLYSKDIKLEFRSRESLLPMFVFGLLVLTIFNFSFEFSPAEMKSAAGGMLWIAFTFSLTLGISRSFGLEKEYGSLDSTLLMPVDRGLIFLGKLLSNFTFALVQEALLLPFFFVFFNFSLFPDFGWFLAVICLGTFGFCAVSTLFSALTLSARMREILMPLLVFPVYIPAVIGSVKAASTIIRGEPLAWAAMWIKLIVVFDIVFATLAYILFEFVLEEQS
ncbi:MAG: heme exporter protein CcmB [Acidobacteria bacterium]|nr:heme exporter protein CcmB [Acidobacteriota bacterium]